MHGRWRFEMTDFNLQQQLLVHLHELLLGPEGKSENSTWELQTSRHTLRSRAVTSEGHLLALEVAEATTVRRASAAFETAATASATPIPETTAATTATTAAEATAIAAATATTSKAAATTTTTAATTLAARRAEVEAGSATVDLHASGAVDGGRRLFYRAELDVAEALGCAAVRVGGQADAEDGAEGAELLRDHVLGG